MGKNVKLVLVSDIGKKPVLVDIAIVSKKTRKKIRKLLNKNRIH